MPVHLKEAYDRCADLPRLDLLDSFRDDGRKSKEFYSYPEFFMNEWVKLMSKEQQEQKRKRKAKKQQNIEKRTHDVSEVEVKRYNQYGEVVTTPDSKHKSSFRKSRSSRKAPSAPLPAVSTITPLIEANEDQTQVNTELTPATSQITEVVQEVIDVVMVRSSSPVLDISSLPSNTTTTTSAEGPIRIDGIPGQLVVNDTSFLPGLSPQPPSTIMSYSLADGLPSDNIFLIPLPPIPNFEIPVLSAEEMIPHFDMSAMVAALPLPPAPPLFLVPNDDILFNISTPLPPPPIVDLSTFPVDIYQIDLSLPPPPLLPIPTIPLNDVHTSNEGPTIALPPPSIISNSSSPPPPPPPPFIPPLILSASTSGQSNVPSPPPSLASNAPSLIAMLSSTSKLKSITQPSKSGQGRAPPPAAESRSDVLSSIRTGGFALRKVEKPVEVVAKKTSIPAGNDVASILMRRAALEMSDSEGSDGEDDDDDEWA